MPSSRSYIGSTGHLSPPRGRPARALSSWSRGRDSGTARGTRSAAAVVGTLPSGDVREGAARAAREGPSCLERDLHLSSLVTSGPVRATGTALGGAGELLRCRRGDITSESHDRRLGPVHGSAVLAGRPGRASTRPARERDVRVRAMRERASTASCSRMIAPCHGHTEAAREATHSSGCATTDDAEALASIAAESCGLVPAYEARPCSDGRRYVERARSRRGTATRGCPNETHPSYGARRRCVVRAPQASNGSPSIRRADRASPLHSAARVGACRAVSRPAPARPAAHGWRPRIETSTRMLGALCARARVDRPCRDRRHSGLNVVSRTIAATSRRRPAGPGGRETCRAAPRREGAPRCPRSRRG